MGIRESFEASQRVNHASRLERPRLLWCWAPVTSNQTAFSSRRFDSLPIYGVRPSILRFSNLRSTEIRVIENRRIEGLPPSFPDQSRALDRGKKQSERIDAGYIRIARREMPNGKEKIKWMSLLNLANEG
jgi:hypothetical protein